MTNDNLKKITAMSGGAALLVLFAVFLSGTGLDTSRLGAAVVCSIPGQCQDTNGNLTLTAAQGVVRLGQGTTITWSANDVVGTDETGYTGFGDGVTRDVPLQTITGLSTVSSWETFKDGVDTYLLAADNTTNAKVYKAMPPVLPFVLGSSGTTTTNKVYLTSGTSWTVPNDWNSTNNKIEVIGGGGGGGTGTTRGPGGGGGAYSKVSNLALSPGTSVTYAVGIGGGANTTGGDTYFCNSVSNCASISGTAVQVGAKGGTGGNGAGGTAAGGAAASGIGTTKYSGGAGQTPTSPSTIAGTGGGAGGPSGNGGTGGTGWTGGSADNGTVAGGAVRNNGITGTQWDATHGSGSGSGGEDRSGQVGHAGGTYGGGGGGGWSATGGIGGGGIVAITYSTSSVVGPAFTAQYYNNTALSGSPVLTRQENSVNYNWGTAAPAAGVNADNFSVRWIGTTTAPVAGSYTFSVVADDGVRLWLDNVLVIDKWITQGATRYDYQATLSANQQVVVKMEYYDGTGSAVAKLAWTFPGSQGTPAHHGCLGDGLTCNTPFQNLSVTGNANGWSAFTAGGSIYAGLSGATSYAFKWMLGPNYANNHGTFSGSNNHGTLQNGPTTGVAGKIGEALSFNGSAQYVNVPDNNALDPSQITIAAWVKIPVAPTTNGNIVAKGNNSGYRLRISNSGVVVWFDRGCTNCLSTTQTVPLNQWTHIAVTGDATGLRIYIDGVLSASNAVAYGTPNTTSALLVGAETAYNEYFNGTIDDVRVYNRALSVSEVSTLYNLGSVNNGLAGYWTFDNANISGATAYDTALPLVTGKIGDALSLDGVDDYVSVPDSASLNVGVGSFSTAAWVKLSSTASGRVVNKFNAGTSAGWLFDVNNTTTGTNSPGFVRFRIRDGTANFDYATNGSLGTGSWKHVVATVNRTTNELKLFVDGVQVGATQSISSVTGSLSTATALGIGTIPSTLGSYFPGSLDDLRVYNRALSASEVSTLAAQGSVASGLVGYWTFDTADISGTTVYDKNPNPILGSCLGSGITCGTALQTFAVSAANNEGLNFTIPSNGDTYLAFLPFQNVYVYKFIPSGLGGRGCFGDANNTCGTIYQSVASGNSPYGGSVITIGGASYLLVVNIPSRSLLYKWTPSGSGCPAGGGWGNGVACTTYYHIVGGYGGSTNSSQHFGGTTYTLPNGNSYLSLVTTGVANEFWGTSKWTPSGVPFAGATGCFGDGVSTCNALYDVNPRGNSFWRPNVFQINNEAFLAVTVKNNWLTYIYKWTPAGTTGCPSGGGWGNGTTSCPPSSPSLFQGPASPGGDDSQFFTSNGASYLATGANIFKYSSGLSTAACTLTGPSGQVGTGASGSYETPAITGDTTFTLTCTTGSGAQESVAVTLTVDSTPQDATFTYKNQAGTVGGAAAYGETASLSWNATGVDAGSCGVTGVNPYSTTSPISIIGAGNSRTDVSVGTLSLSGTHTYVLNCLYPFITGNNGVLTGGVTTGATGKIAEALSFDGVDDYVSMGASTLASLDNVNKTISAWVKKTGSSQKGIVDKDFDNGGSNYGGWGFWVQSNGKLSWWAQGGKDLLDTGPTSISNGQWTHVVVVWRASSKTAEFYINGVLNSTKTDATIVEKVSGSAPLIIGGLRNGLSPYNFDGFIDDVRVYNRALSASEVSTLSNQGSVASGLVGYWTFDTLNLFKTTAYDSSGGVFTRSLPITAAVVPPNYIPNITGAGVLTVSPPRVRKGGTTNLSWNVAGLVPGDPRNSCTITATPSSALSSTFSWDGNGTAWVGGPVVSNAIQSRTTFTLTCTAPDGVTQTSTSVSVNLIPVVQEI